MPVAATTKLQSFWRDGSVSKEFRTGVSLHSHTMYSEESLDIVPRYTHRAPYLYATIRRQQAEYSRKTGRDFDFRHAFWTPPFAPRQAYRIEEKQIQRQFQLPALVSITDHDDIRSGTLLRVLERFRGAPISTEWTVPFGPTFFHLGIHNLPPLEAGDIMGHLSCFTANPQEAKLGEMLGMLNSYRDVLLVLNHPLWDEKGIGAANHAQVLERLLVGYRRDIHALELNGLRSWQENRDVLRVAQRSGLPLVGGGDRHGREPNAVVNLSRADNTADFIREIRYSRCSHVVFMPSYREPLKLRMLQMMVDVFRDYPENLQGRQRWADRFFYRDPTRDETVPLSSLWEDGGPKLVRQFIGIVRLLQSRTARSLLRIALEDGWKNSGKAALASFEADPEQAV